MISSSISRTAWYGQESWVIESDFVRTAVVPEMGAKLVSLFDKRTQREWLAAPGDRPFQKVAYGADFVEQDMSGWDEMFPTIVACNYPVPGAQFNSPLPDHGEIWPLSWEIEPADPHSLRTSVEGKALPYRLTRTLAYSAADTLQMQYELHNLGLESMPYIWSAHPQFLCGAGAQIVLPSDVTEVCNVLPAEWGWGELETRFAWPEALTVTGRRVRIDQVGPSTLKEIRKFFVTPEKRAGWAGLICQPEADWLRLDWDPQQVPYLGIWIDEGLLSHESVAALEPMTGYYDSLAVAWQKKQVRMIEAGEIQSWTLAVRLGIGGDPSLTGGK